MRFRGNKFGSSLSQLRTGSSQMSRRSFATNRTCTFTTEESRFLSTCMNDYVCMICIDSMKMLGTKLDLGRRISILLSRNGRPLKFQISVQNSCIYCNVSVHTNCCIFPVMLLTNSYFILPRYAALIAKIFLVRITQVLQFVVSYEYKMQKYY
jgi:hypothetical protein